MYEIYFNHSNDELMVEDHQKKETLPLMKMGLPFLMEADKHIQEQYPDTHETICLVHGDKKEFVYARVRHFFSCNFSVKDGRPDIDEDWNFDLENVPCPARINGTCKGGICNPTFSTDLTSREKEVLRLYVKGFDESEIAEVLFISKNTVHNHINNLYAKTGVKGKSCPDRRLVAYAYSKKIV